MCRRGEGERLKLYVEVDKCLVPLVKTLNKYGIKVSSCCCGHGEKLNGKKINNNIILLTRNASLGIEDKNGKAKGWVSPSEFNVWGVAFPIEKRMKEGKS